MRARIGRIDRIDMFGVTRDYRSPYLVKATTGSPFKSNDSSLIDAVPIEVFTSNLRGIRR